MKKKNFHPPQYPQPFCSTVLKDLDCFFMVLPPCTELDGDAGTVIGGVTE